MFVSIVGGVQAIGMRDCVGAVVRVDGVEHVTAGTREGVFVAPAPEQPRAERFLRGCADEGRERAIEVIKEV